MKHQLFNKTIKTEDEHKKALELAESLIDVNPEPETEEANHLELLTLLIQEYEKKKIDLGLPDPIEAIKFRMEQQNLKQKDLVPFIGSKSKVSEVLSGQRKLSLSMIRSLSSGLGIPEKVLIQDYAYPNTQFKPNFDMEDFPIKDLLKVGWLSQPNEPERLEMEFQKLIAPMGIEGAQNVLFRMTRTIRTDKVTNHYALIAWTAKILKEAEKNDSSSFDRSNLTKDFLGQIVKLSTQEEGPLLAKDKLAEIGISLVTLPPLPEMFIDGAAILNEDPVIGLTLRYDRLDNFWFTLMHELSHVYLHYGKKKEFFDDLEFGASGEPEEVEADHLAGNMLIPNDIWLKSAASRLPTAEAAKSLAKKLNINVAIVAGRIRREFDDYKLLTRLIGIGKVRKQFGVGH